MSKLIHHQLSLAMRKFRDSGTPREWINTALLGIAVAAAFVALYILL